MGWLGFVVGFSTWIGKTKTEDSFQQKDTNRPEHEGVR